MKRTLILTAILICASLLQQIRADVPTRKALLVGVGNYPARSGWNRLSSARDIDLLKGILAPTFRTKCLVDNQATYFGITGALDNLCREVNAGDTVLVHFSCHGQQKFTTSPNELDRLDESLIPFDALARESDTYHGEKHLIDDVLGEKTEAIRKKMAGRGLLIVSLDACHSGNSIKGGDNPPDSLCRGINDIFGVKYPSDIADSLEFLRYAPDTTKLSQGTPTVFISACGSTEKNYEFLLADGTRFGSLSLSLYEAIRETGLRDVNAFLDCIHAKMERYGRRQTPQFISSFGYATPKVQDAVPADDDENEADEDEGEETGIPEKILILAATVVVLLLVLVAYGRRKKQ